MFPAAALALTAPQTASSSSGTWRFNDHYAPDSPASGLQTQETGSCCPFSLTPLPPGIKHLRSLSRR